MRILFHVTLTTMLRHFEEVILALAERGHAICVASPDRRRDLPPPAALASDNRITFVSSPARRGDLWAERIHQLRTLRDYLRYLDPPFAAAHKLRNRAIRQMVKAITNGGRSHLVAYCPRCEARLVDHELGRMLQGSGTSGTANIGGLLELMEATVPSDPSIEAFLRAEQPDVLLVTPLVTLGSYQADFVKSAKALGIPVAFPVFSWDNLSTKGLIHVRPDRVLVWNERQRTEAVEMHGMAAEQVVVTGAPRFDAFFAMRPQVSREQFCDAYGLDARQATITYLCSSEFVAGGEVDYVLRWVDHVRREPTLAECNILIRPHPREQKQWKQVVPGAGVAIAFPQAMNADQTLFDAAYHSAAVVGLNTSAQLEAGIAGTPVFTVLAPEFAEGQQGTLHFHYLLREHGGFVEVAADYDTHRRQLAAAVAGARNSAAIRTFIEQFLRPHGVDRPATPIMVEAIEAVGGVGRAANAECSHAAS